MEEEESVPSETSTEKTKVISAYKFLLIFLLTTYGFLSYVLKKFPLAQALARENGPGPRRRPLLRHRRHNYICSDENCLVQNKLFLIF